ncbi:hypothetical protein CR513_33421, partial [Mucuna pruriens]
MEEVVVRMEGVFNKQIGFIDIVFGNFWSWLSAKWRGLHQGSNSKSSTVLLKSQYLVTFFLKRLVMTYYTTPSSMPKMEQIQPPSIEQISEILQKL